jgi:hypothetical protein
MRRNLGPKRDEVTREWRKLHNEELNGVYYSPNVIRLIQLRMRWTGHVECMGIGEVNTGFTWGDLRKNDHLEDLGIDGSIISR